MNILFVEVHHDTAQSFARLLTLLGHRVETANCVAAVVELASHQRFDLLMCDIGLPDGDGCELLKTLSVFHPLKAVAISGFGMKEDIERALTAGFSAYLIKPVLFEKIESLLQQFAMESVGSSVSQDAHYPFSVSSL